MEVEVKPASAEELDAFLGQNRRWIPDDAEKVLRGMSGLDQRRVISGGTMSSVQNPVAVIQARVRKAKELEAAVSRSGGKVPAVLMGLESKLIKLWTQDLDAFIKANDRWLGDEAVQTLRSMSAFDQRRVISAGTMSGCRDPVAVIQTRAKKAREMEMELENLAAGKGPLLKKEKPQAPAPSFDEEAAAMHLYAPPEEVLAWESRFAPPPIEDEDSALVGESPGVGGCDACWIHFFLANCSKPRRLWLTYRLCCSAAIPGSKPVRVCGEFREAASPFQRSTGTRDKDKTRYGFGWVQQEGSSTTLRSLPTEEDQSHRSRRLQSDEVETTTEAPDFYWDDLLLDKPYNKEPAGKKFLIVFHCIGIAYLVLGLNTVCDVYFAGSIDLLCDAWNLTPDVAGATWMAAGGSAPEFFTSIVGATIAQNDVGFGTIVGSAVFNVLFVIGLCGYVAKGNIELTWWPLFRETWLRTTATLCSYDSANRKMQWQQATTRFPLLFAQ
eukprot:s1613_g8.t1